MAIFTKTDAPSPTSSETTIIASGANIKGDFNIKTRLHVDGVIEGQINSNSVVVVGRKGVVKGNLKSEKLIINGQFYGNADCSSIEILESGKLIGDIVSEILVIEPKAIFEGHSAKRSSLKLENSKNTIENKINESLKIGDQKT